STPRAATAMRIRKRRCSLWVSLKAESCIGLWLGPGLTLTIQVNNSAGATPVRASVRGDSLPAIARLERRGYCPGWPNIIRIFQHYDKNGFFEKNLAPIKKRIYPVYKS